MSERDWLLLTAATCGTIFSSATGQTLLLTVQAILHRHLTQVHSHWLFATYVLVICFMIKTYAFGTYQGTPLCPNLQCLRTKPREWQQYHCESPVTGIPPHKVTIQWKLFYSKIEPKNNLNFLLTLNTTLLLNDLQRRNLSQMHVFHGTKDFFPVFPISYWRLDQKSSNSSSLVISKFQLLEQHII